MFIKISVCMNVLLTIVKISIYLRTSRLSFLVFKSFLISQKFEYFCRRTSGGYDISKIHSISQLQSFYNISWTLKCRIQFSIILPLSSCNLFQKRWTCYCYGRCFVWKEENRICRSINQESIEQLLETVVQSLRNVQT